MTRAIWKGTLCAALLCAGTVLAKSTPTAQQQCDFARITAWAKYVSCIDAAVAKDARGLIIDGVAAFAKCRQKYFKNWAKFQTNSSLAGTTCQPVGGGRFVDNGDGTVTDNLTGLVWEKKTTDTSVHDEGNLYTWSTGSNNEDGTAFTSFLGTLNGEGGFAGANGWRLPTLAELQTIVPDVPCDGPDPCIDPTFGPTQSYYYWSATSYVPVPSDAWAVAFSDGLPSN
jgi:hypothetical protein